MTTHITDSNEVVIVGDKAWCPQCNKEVTEKEIAANYGVCAGCDKRNNEEVELL